MALTKIKADGLTADIIDETKLADNSIDSEHYNDGSIDNAHLADDAVGVAELSATGTASSSTFLRGDNTWATPTDTNTVTTINNNADNRVITGSGTANTLEGEANLQFDGTNLGVGGAATGVSNYSTLHLKGPSSGNGGAIRLQDHGDTADSDDFTIYKNSAGGYLRINGTDPFIVYMNGAERMRIDSSGIVTKPYQPSFAAYSTGSWTHGSDTGTLNIDTITTEAFDVGGNYNHSTGVFTAPVAGKYFFSFTYSYICTSGYLNIYLKKGVSGTYSSYARMQSSPPQQSSNYSDASGISGIIDLAAQNTVRPQAELNYAGNQIWNINFSGYLIG